MAGVIVARCKIMYNVSWVTQSLNLEYNFISCVGLVVQEWLGIDETVDVWSPAHDQERPYDSDHSCSCTGKVRALVLMEVDPNLLSLFLDLLLHDMLLDSGWVETERKSTGALFITVVVFLAR